MAGNQFKKYPAYCPKTVEIDSSTPVTFMRRSGSDNGWMDNNVLEEEKQLPNNEGATVEVQRAFGSLATRLQQLQKTYQCCVRN